MVALVPAFILLANGAYYLSEKKLGIPSVADLAGTSAFLGALFLAFDPFFLAHSRVAHGDAPVAVFMNLSVLSLLIYTERLRAAPSLPPLALFRQPAFIYLLISAVCGGLAALTKAPGQFMALFTVELALLYFSYDWRYNSHSNLSSNR